MTVLAVIKHIWYIPRYLIMAVIWLYQRILSPDHGLFRVMFPNGYCKFSPTCSQYSIQAVYKYGVIIGVPKALWRVMRCNPWNKGGDDPVK